MTDGRDKCFDRMGRMDRMNVQRFKGQESVEFEILLTVKFKRL